MCALIFPNGGVLHYNSSVPVACIVFPGRTPVFAKVGRTRISMFLHGAVGTQAMMFFRCNNTVTACFEQKRDEFVERVALIAGVEKGWSLQISLQAEFCLVVVLFMILPNPLLLQL